MTVCDDVVSAPLGGGRSQWWRSLLFIVPLVVVWMVPVAVLVIAEPVADRAQATRAAVPQPEVVTVGSRTPPAGHVVTVRVTSSDSYSLAARRAGTVTAIDVQVGDSPPQGAPLLAVDGVPVLAFRSDVPLFRDLARGDQGSDVKQLGGFLVSLGLLSSSAVSEVFGPELEAGVKQLQSGVLGVKATGRFALDYVTFVPTSTGPVASVDVQVGHVIMVGADMVTMGGLPTGASLLEPTSGAPFTWDGNGWSLQAGGQSSPLPTNGFDAAGAAALEQFLITQMRSGTVTMAGSPGAGGPGGAGGTSAVAMYNGAMAVQATPPSGGTVPASAVYVAPNGTACVVLSDGGYRVVALPGADVVAGEVGVIGVPAELIGLSVVRDPTVLDSGVLAACASK